MNNFWQNFWINWKSEEIFSIFRKNESINVILFLSIKLHMEIQRDSYPFMVSCGMYFNLSSECEF